jgi:bacterioferritin
MKGDATVIQHLNIILKNELTAINQYFLHARLMENWGILKLAKKEYEESLGEMNHADWLIQRIIMLDGLPNVQDLGNINVGENVPEAFKADLNLEVTNQTCLKEAIGVCEQARDFVSRETLNKILDDTEEHIDYLETQFDLMETVGLNNYLQEQMYDTGDKD